VLWSSNIIVTIITSHASMFTKNSLKKVQLGPSVLVLGGMHFSEIFLIFDKNYYFLVLCAAPFLVCNILKLRRV
jgi:hypothetical protein